MTSIPLPAERPEPGIRAITHAHTLHSWDSRTSIRRTVNALEAADVQLALITDHNSYDGARRCRAEAKRRELAIRIPTAAEIRTDRGDVIVVFDHDDPPPVSDLVTWESLPERVRDSGGLIWIPHPYQSHTEVEELAEAADVVEIFNARCSTRQNERAVELCARTGTVPAYGTDAHRAVELTRWTVTYPGGLGSVLDTLRCAPFADDARRTRTSDIAAAEVNYGLHRRSPKKLAFFSVKWAWTRAREARDESQ